MRYLDSSRPVRLFILAIVPAICAFGSPALADDPTVYKIHNRWLNTQYLAAGDGKVIYGPGNDARFQWTLQDVHGLERIENIGTHEYMIVAPGSTDVTLAKTAPADASGLWDITVGVAPWSRRRVQRDIQFWSHHRHAGRGRLES
ncbi:MAG TPA: hypothetical protein VFE47_08445 [Tepidisphaeraceae bacterium]|nr:hypothetical protein [Tepidisphaeraceae bacterium]